MQHEPGKRAIVYSGPMRINDDHVRICKDRIQKAGAANKRDGWQGDWRRNNKKSKRPWVSGEGAAEERDQRKSKIVAPLEQPTTQNKVQSEETRDKECQATRVATGDAEHMGVPSGSLPAS